MDQYDGRVFDDHMPADESEAVELIRPRVLKIVESVLRDSELDWVEVTGRGSRIDVRLSAGGETMSLPLAGQRMDSDAPLEIFASGLEDFIAESGFGWGQQRTVPPHLYSSSSASD